MCIYVKDCIYVYELVNVCFMNVCVYMYDCVSVCIYVGVFYRWKKRAWCIGHKLIIFDTFFGRSAKIVILLPALAYLGQEYESNQSTYPKKE